MFSTPKAKRAWVTLNEAIESSTKIPGCRDSDPDAFFPAENAAGYYKPTKAIELCQSCPVIAMCLDFALLNNEIHGIWGGMNTRQRQQFKKRK